LIHKIQKLDKNVLRNSVTTIGLDANIIDRLYAQFESNLSVIDEPARRLTHGDPGFDNVLVRNDEVVAVIDWGALGYGDWLFDMARLDFWWLGRYGEIRNFAIKHSLETENLEQRVALYWAYFALTTLEFAFTGESESTKHWLVNSIESKLIQC